MGGGGGGVGLCGPNYMSLFSSIYINILVNKAK